MDYHQNARLTVHSREQLARCVVERGGTLKAAAAAFNVSAKTAAKWVRRYRRAGGLGCKDLSSKPHRSPRRTSSSLLERVLVLRRQRWNGWRIAHELKLSRATVSRILRRAGLNRLRSLDPPPPVVRYEHKHPGDLIHFDIKRLARIVKPGHRIHGDRTRRRPAARATNTCTSPSTTTPASPSPPSCPTRPITRPCASSSWRGPTTRASASPSAACSPTTAPAISTGCFASCCIANTSSTASLGPTPRAPTARPNASSRPLCVNGLTPALTKTQTNASSSSILWLHDYNFHQASRQPQPQLTSFPLRLESEQPLDPPHLERFHFSYDMEKAVRSGRSSMERPRTRHCFCKHLK